MHKPGGDMRAHRQDPDVVSAQIELVAVPCPMIGHQHYRTADVACQGCAHGELPAGAWVADQGPGVGRALLELAPRL
jgi:hypothetical protein